MLVASCGVVGAVGSGLGAVPSHHDQRVEVQGRALTAVDRVVPVGVEGVPYAVLVLAVCGKGNDVRCDVQHEAGGRVEDVAPEIENQRREDEHHTAADALVPDHVGKALVEERGFVDYVRAHRGIVGNDLLEIEGVADARDVLPAADVAASEGHGVFRVFCEPGAVYLASDEEDLAPVHIACAGEGLDLVALAHGYGGIAPDLGSELGLARAHGPYQKNPSARTGEIEVREGLVDFQGRKAQAFEKILAGIDGTAGTHAFFSAAPVTMAIPALQPRRLAPASIIFMASS